MKAKSNKPKTPEEILAWLKEQQAIILLDDSSACDALVYDATAAILGDACERMEEMLSNDGYITEREEEDAARGIIRK